MRVHMRGRVPMFGSTCFPIPADFDTDPSVTSDAAWLAAWMPHKSPSKQVVL